MSLKLFACGDVVNFSAKSDFIDERLKAIVKDSDIAICNFEAPIEIETAVPIKKAGPHLYQSRRSVSLLKEAGFDVLSLANNHIYDNGDKALNATIQEIEDQEIEHIGVGSNFEDAYTAKIIEKKGIKVGILSGCESEFGCPRENENRGGYAWINHYLIEDSIRDLKNKVDIIIFVAHAGVEDIDLPIPEWRERYRRLCDVGCDAIIGHHPHVPQGFENYRNSKIFYSLGNFYFDTTDGLETQDSYSIVLTINKDSIQHCEVVYHKQIDNQAVLVGKEDVDFSIEDLIGKLTNNYETVITSQVVDLYLNRYLPYYESALDSYPKKRGVFKKIKFFARAFLLCKKETRFKSRGLLLLHNIRIDLHRFVVQRTLSNLFEK